MKHAAFPIVLLMLLPVAARPEPEGVSLDLNDRYDYRFLGAESGDRLGVQVRFGDLDGDGYDEVILASWLAGGNRNERPRCGEVSIFFGRDLEESGAGRWDATVIYGPVEKCRLGSAADTGDYDGDGVLDLLIGARYSDGPVDSLREGCGEAFLLLGASNHERKELVDLRRRPDGLVIGRSEGDRLGRRILVTDLDRDGKDDLVLAAPGSSGERGEREDAGALFLLYGGRRSDWEGVIDLSLQETAILHGADEADGLGNALAAGDWNGDGVPDLVLGCGFADGPANSRTNGGETFVLFGEPGVRIEGERTVVEGTDFTIYGGDAYDAAGVGVAAGDFDADGIDDLVIGANLADGPEDGRENAGEVYLLFGSRTVDGRSASIDLKDRADLTLYGEREGDQLGSIVHLFDWNEDGYDDLVVSSLLHDGPGRRRPKAGMIAVLLGARQASLHPRIDLGKEEADRILIGPSVEDRVSTLLADGRFRGRSCLIAGTMLGDGPLDERTSAGEIYILPWGTEGSGGPADGTGEE